MVQYNPHDWFTFIFRLHKADTFRKLLPMMIAFTVYSLIVVWFERSYLNLPESHPLKNLTSLHNLLGFAISMLLVFRTNTAYDRWWEGRKLWGSLVNNSRNLAIKINALFQDDSQTRSYFRMMIPAFAGVLHRHLRSEKPTAEMFDGEESVWEHLRGEVHAPNKVTGLMYDRLVKLQRAGKLEHTQMLWLQPEMQGFADICGACERIKNTPIPFSYNIFLKKFIFIYTMTLPFALAMSLSWFAVAVSVLIFYVLASLELIAEEIEDPFGGDANDLPTVRIAQNIQKNVQEIIQ